MSKNIKLDENIDNTASQDISLDTDTEVVKRSDVKFGDSSVILGDGSDSSSESDFNEDTSGEEDTGEDEINFDIDLDTMRVRSNVSLNNYQRISASYGYAIFIENTALKLNLGNVLLSGKKLFRIKNSFVDMTLTGLSLAWEVNEEDDLDYESTLVIKLTEGSEFTGNFNKNNRIEIGNISVTVDDTSRWNLTGDSYIEEFNITDNSRVTLNGYRIFVRTRVEPEKEGGKVSYIWRKWVQYPPKMVSEDTGYDSYGVPTTRVLKVIKYQFLPPYNERRKSYIYFCYDRMQLYLYQSLYTDPFCIVDQIPNNPVENMLYITTEGKMYTYYSGKRTFIGEVERDTTGTPDQDQIDLIKQVGTIYFMNAESRYIDFQSRTIQLPFHNGSYILSLSLGSDLRIDEHTVIRYNPNTEQFYIAGQNYQYDDRLNNVNKYVGYATETTQTFMDNYTFRTHVNISDKDHNGIQVADTGGLYVDVSDLASQEKYEKMVQSFNTYKTTIDRYMDQLVDAVNECTREVTPDLINTKIVEALRDYYDTIDTAIEEYDNMRAYIENLETRVTTQMRQALQDDKAEIYNLINESRWSYFDPSDTYSARNVVVSNKSKSWDRLFKASVISWYRSYLLFYRNEYSDYGGKVDIFGYNAKERWLLNRIFAYDLESLGNPDVVGYKYYLSENDLPETGEERPVYFVINITKTNRIYKIFKWYDSEYHLLYDGSTT